MTTATTTGRMLFVTLPVSNIAKSKTFFEALGFSFDADFSSADGERLLIGEDASIMLTAKDKFVELSKLPMGDPKQNALALYSFTVPTRDEVNTVADAALAAGAIEANPFEDFGFMCSRSFFDLDGHGWQVMWMDMSATAAN